MRMRLPICVLSLCVALPVAKSAAQEVAAPATRPSAAGAPADTGWPRTFNKDGNQVVIYQPQIDDWQDYAKIAFRAAISVQPAGAKEPVYGVLAVKAITVVDHDARTVLLTNFDPNVRFADVPKDKAAPLEGLVRQMLPQRQYMVISLDRVLAHLDAGKVTSSGVKVNLSPPPIFRSESPAILVVFVGKPQFKPIKDTSLTFAVNTNWDVLMDRSASQYYLLDGNSWLMATEPMKGPWGAVKALPADFSKLPADQNWNDVRTHIPGEPAKVVPKVFVSTEPAELIVTKGPPEFAPIEGTSLLYVDNPEMPLFQDSADKSYYYLVAGRWFRAKGLNGPWSQATTDLPADFSKIPSDSPVSYVLASVPQTSQAQDAVLLASVPHKATINRQEAKVDVTYDGDPQFQPIAGTTMKYAVNSSYQVINANDQYYCCYNGVWFVSPVSIGPWVVCTSVPAEIYTIPPTSPVYNVTYVKVYDTSPDTVTVGYTAGYTGEYVAATGTLMFGAGMLAGAALANPYSWYSCNPAFYSYGCAAEYHYGYGGYYRGAANYGPYGGAGYAAAYNPATGTFARAGYRYGPAGATWGGQAYNPYTGRYAAHAGATNGYQSWGHTAVSEGGAWAQAGHVSGERGTAGYADTSSGRGVAGVHGAEGGTVAKTGSGNVYAGKDGNVYRKTDDGWQHYQAGNWQNAERSEAGMANRDVQNGLNRDSMARDYGNQRAMESQQFHDYGGFHGAEGGGGGWHGGEGWGGGGGGFRGGGGGFRGGRR